MNKNKASIKQTQIDVCILTAGRFDLLEKCLDAVYRDAQLIPLNILIFDNGSDGKERLSHSEIFEYSAEKDPMRNVVQWGVKRSQNNLGFPKGANENARMGKAPIVMFLSDDIELLPGAIEKIVSDFKDETIGIVGTRLLFPPTSTDPIRPAGKVQHCGLAVNVRGDIIHPLVGWSNDNPKTKVSRDVWATTGACITIRRSLFNKIGGFDPAYGLGTFEDADLCMKVRQTNSRVYFDAEAQGYHYVGATAEKRQQPFPLQQNRQIFMSKWQNSGLFYWTEYEYY